MNARRLLPRIAFGLLAAVALVPRLLARVRSPVAWIDAEDVKSRLDRGEALTVIDVRGADEFSGPLGHLATARNIPVAELEGRLTELAGLEREPIVLVCLTDRRSAAAAQVLRAAGFRQVQVLRRGMTRWNEAGLPAEGRSVERAGVGPGSDAPPGAKVTR